MSPDQVYSVVVLYRIRTGYAFDTDLSRRTIIDTDTYIFIANFSDFNKFRKFTCN